MGKYQPKILSISPIILTEPTFVNTSRRFHESPRCFCIKHFKTLKGPPKINVATEKFLISSRSIDADQKRPLKIWCDSPFKADKAY